MKTRIYINRQIIDRNRKTGEREPPITAKTYKGIRRGRSVHILGASKVVYSPDKPLDCGATVWIETDAVVVTKGD